MGTTAQKLEYLGTTKSQLKDMINYGLDDNNKITNSTTFRNYVSSIFNAFLEALRTPDTLFTNLPKKSGTGANITLNDTVNAPMRITLGASELSQDATPTPSSPQAVHTISGSNTIKVRGKNLIDIASTYTLTEYKTIQVNIPAGTYVLSVDSRTSTADSSLVLFQNGNTTISQTYLSVGSLEKNINLSTKVNKMLIYSGSNYAENVNVETTFTNLMVSKDGGTYEPYISQEADIDLDTLEYCKIGNYEDKFIRSNDGTWQLEKNIGKVVLNGTEAWEQYATEPSGLKRACLPYSNVRYEGQTATVLSNKLVGTKYSGSWNNTFECIASYTSGLIAYLDSVSNLTEFKNKLSSGYIVYYQLATPTYTQITGTLETQLENVYQKLLSYSGTTNISQVNNDLAFNMSVQAIEK